MSARSGELQAGQTEGGHIIQFSIYHSDGKYLAKLEGARLFPTPEGKKAGLTVSYPKDMTVCKMNGKTIIELKRTGAAAVATEAELFTPQGAFLKCRNSDPPVELYTASEEGLRRSGILMRHSVVSDRPIGVLIKADGSVGFGVR